jgi:hypothetical protein
MKEAEEMMAAAIGYPCFNSGEPVRLSATGIRAVGDDLRRRLFGFAIRPLDVSDLARRTASLSVNGRRLRIAWDMGNAVHDEFGDPVLGVCEHDPSEPGTVLISLNADILGDQPELLRSTAAHELGHAIFDMPAAVDARRARAFRSRGEVLARREPIDWKEWRADEFMGSFLAPRRQLTRSFAREASTHGAELRWSVDEGVPTPFIRASETGWPIIEGITGAIAEELGLSIAFLDVRLRKYALVR